MLFYFPTRSGIVCWWCSLGSFRWPGRLAYSWNSANGCPVPVKLTPFWESSPPLWRFSSRFSQLSGRILTRRRDRFSTGSIGWSETPRTSSPVSIAYQTYFRFNLVDFRLLSYYTQPWFCFMSTVLTIFFAVTLSKAELPAWMDWILVAYVGFYVIIHLILSVSTNRTLDVHYNIIYTVVFLTYIYPYLYTD